MEIRLPERLTFAAYAEGARASFAASLLTKSNVTFDWRPTRWADLPAIAAVLTWSSYLRQSKGVSWILQNPLERTRDADERRFEAELELGPEAYRRTARILDALRKDLATQNLFPRRRREKLDEFKDNRHPQTTRWLAAETLHWDAADLIGYLHRYGVFARAEERGIQITPDPETIARSKLARGSESASMSFRTIDSSVDVERAARDLSDLSTLEKILGRYADVEVVKRGALASILVTELGSNVTEHAYASGAWLTSRAVTEERVNDHVGDPVAASFVNSKNGFLEILICDDGRGLTTGLDRVLSDDARRSIRERYSLDDGAAPAPHHLIDYAFDRFSSTKRKLHQIVEGGAEGPSLGVSSGLYWIWNFARTHKGVVSACAAGACMTYDFTKRMNGSLPEPVVAPGAGTLIRIALPLAVVMPVVTKPEEPEEDAIEALPPSIAAVHYFNVTDFARMRPVWPMHGRQLIFPQLSARSELIRRLVERHARLRDGDVLLLDLTGTRDRWEKITTELLCRFFLEANYTSTAGRSATVLWNVPEQSLAVFEQAIEIATRDYWHLRGIRRGAMMITSAGKLSLIAGSEAVERVMRKFGDQDAATLEELGVHDLSAEDQAGVVAFLLDNEHLFDFHPSSSAVTYSTPVRMRAWASALRSLPWIETQRWFEEKLNAKFADGGILVRKAPGEGYFRLPSSDLFSRDFYHFRSFLSNSEAFGRVSWMLTEIFRALARRERIDTIVALSRPAMALAGPIADAIAVAGMRRPELLTAETLEVLSMQVSTVRKPLGNAVFLLTALSTGRLCSKVAALLDADQVSQWVATVACLDVRGEAVAQPVSQMLTSELDTIVCEPAGETGPVYPLAIREVKKYTREEVGDEPVTSIDPANLCPIDRFRPQRQQTPNPEKAVWNFLDTRASAFRVGHFHSGDYHHYLYHLDAERLLTTKGKKRNLLEYTVEQATADLRDRTYDPSSVIIFYPPREESGGEMIGRAIQQHVGALYEFTLHRDFFAGEWRFSPYAEHGLPLEGATVILVDDGSNTGETLMGLLHAATMGKPATILAYVGLQRLPPHKMRLFNSLRSLAECDDVRVWFGARLSIPVFSPRTCPVCRLRHQLTRVRDSSPLLRTVTAGMVKALDHVPVAFERPMSFLWNCRDHRAAGLLREDLEMFEYRADSDVRLDRRVGRIIHGEGGGSDDLRDFAFVICMEPELARARALSRNVAAVLERIGLAFATCSAEEVVTLGAFAFYLTAFSDVTPPSREEGARIDACVAALLARADLSPRTAGEIVALVAAEHFSQDTMGSRPAITDLWLLAISEGANARGLEPHGPGSSTAAFTAFYANGARAVTGAASEPSDDTEHSFFDFALGVASEFYWHGSANTISNITQIRTALNRGEWGVGPFATPIQSLIRSVSGLEELRWRIRTLENDLLRTASERTKMTAHWYTAPIQTAIDSVAESTLMLHERLQEQQTEENIRQATVAADTLGVATRDLLHHLKTPFDLLFPDVISTVSDEWRAFITSDFGKRFAKEPIRSPEVNEGHCVFFPKPLLERFIDNALRNLHTAAFHGVPPDSMNKARCHIRLRLEDQAEERLRVAVEVIDNGPAFTHRLAVEKAPGQGRGIDDVGKMAEPFDAKVDRRPADLQQTVTSLVMLAYKRPSPRLAAALPTETE